MLYDGPTNFMKNLFDEIISQSRSKQVAEKIKTAISDGRLKLGDKLPPERDLAVQLGVSRSSLREAVRILDAYGLVESNQGGGTYVTDRFTESVFDFLGFGRRLSPVNFRHLLRTRLIIETGAVETAPADSLAETAAILGGLVKRMEAETDLAVLGSLDAQFHECLVERAGNPILTALYRMISKMLKQGTIEVIAYPTARLVAIEDHRELAAGFARGEREACREVVRRHLEHTEELFERYFIEGEAEK
jgi:GntR family transcriptional repressor for pyruvate dehydrogenase complex